MTHREISTISICHAKKFNNININMTQYTTEQITYEDILCISSGQQKILLVLWTGQRASRMP